MSAGFPPAQPERTPRHARHPDRPAARPAKQPARSLRLLAWTKGLTCGGYVRITEGRKVDTYEVTKLPADYGRGFRVQKVHAEPGRPVAYEPAYHVNVDGRGSTCECLGHLRHGRRTVCRHVAALSALIEQGRI